LLAFCSEGNAPSVTSPSAVVPPSVASESGVVHSAADGDVKVGTGALAIARLRLDRQSSPGVSILRQYALPGGSYPMNAGETIELWAEFDPAGIPRNPRLILDWGDGGTDFVGCGSCKLSHKYNARGLFIVAARLDDLSGTMVTRTFFLDSRPKADAPTPTPTASPSPSPKFGPTTGLYGQFNLEGRTVYYYKTSAGQVLDTSTGFCWDRGLSWWTPRSSADAQTVIDGLYGIDNYHTWILSYGLVTSSGRVGGFPVTVEGGNSWTFSSSGWGAVRHWASSFCDPEQHGGRSYCWDTSHSYDWFVCEG
jgi:hypothetical protein